MSERKELLGIYEKAHRLLAQPPHMNHTLINTTCTGTCTYFSYLFSGLLYETCVNRIFFENAGLPGCYDKVDSLTRLTRTPEMLNFRVAVDGMNVLHIRVNLIIRTN